MPGHQTDNQTHNPRSPVTVTFVGSGDAFGSGGRLQTCILVDCADTRFAIDFGATSLVGLRQQGIHPNSIAAIILTHLHGDHCGGIPFLLLDAMLGAKRRTPLTILGPAGARAHLLRLQEALFPGSHTMEPEFELEYREIHPGTDAELLGLRVSATPARHTQETNPLAVRVQIGEKAIAYTGDGELTEALCRLVSGADLLIAECYFYDKPVRWHLNYPDIARLCAKRIVLTHMHGNMLAQVDRVPEECASDGYRLTV
jgi:ribonuclease BN (tRNA processing enzyme)